jgi:hypothetical protein
VRRNISGQAFECSTIFGDQPKNIAQRDGTTRQLRLVEVFEVESQANKGRFLD